MVSILGDMWSSWGLSDICTALAAAEEINAEGSAAGAESGMTCYVRVQQLGRQHQSSGTGVISAGRLARNMTKYWVLSMVVLMQTKNFGGVVRIPSHRCHQL